MNAESIKNVELIMVKYICFLNKVMVNAFVHNTHLKMSGLLKLA